MGLYQRKDKGNNKEEKKAKKIPWGSKQMMHAGHGLHTDKNGVLFGSLNSSNAMYTGQRDF